MESPSRYRIRKLKPYAARTLARVGVAALAAAMSASSAEVSVPQAVGSPGTILPLPVSFASQSSAVTAIQFDLQYDSSALSLSAVAGDAARIAGKTLFFRDLASGQRRFLIAGINQNLLADGALINLFVELVPTAPTGTYPLKLLNVVASDASAHAVTIKAVDGGITVQGTGGPGSRLQPSGVLSAASLLTGPVAPGEIVTLFGSGIGPASPQQPAASATSTVLGGVSVLFDGTPAPLLYAAINQINAIVPFGIDKRTSTHLQLSQQGQAIADLVLAVADTAPAIFTVDASGTGQGAILNQDGTLNTQSNPADKGSVVVLFATGAGQTDPPGTDGQIASDVLPKPLLPTSVQIDNLGAPVLYAGAAPTLVAGVFQVNCVVPVNARSGYTVPIVLTVGNASSPAGVTLAVK